jgi:hypothetical protein
MQDLANAEIRPRKTWRLIFNAFVIGVSWAYFTAAVIGYNNRTHTQGSAGRAALIFLIVTAGLFWVVFTTLKTLFYVETVTVTSSTLTITGRLLGLQLNNHSYDNATVRNLRYDEWPGGRSGTQNGIRFEYNSDTVTFAEQADVTKSWELIDKMCEAYRFSVPKPKLPSGVVSW